MENLEVNEEIAIKVRDVVSKGLVKGLGQPKEGEMCIEAAVCFAYGLPHNDNPPCVGKVVRAFKINLNDSKWSSNIARAEGMKKLAIAQLGSDSIDQIEFSKRLVLKITNNIISEIVNSFDKELAKKIKKVTDLDKAKDLCYAAANAAYAAANAAYAAADAAYAASDAAANAAYAAADAAYADAYAASGAADAAADAAYAAAYAAADAAADAADAAADAADAAYAADTGDVTLIKASDLCLEVLEELNSPGCKYLYVLEK